MNRWWVIGCAVMAGWLVASGCGGRTEAEEQQLGSPIGGFPSHDGGLVPKGGQGGFAGNGGTAGRGGSSTGRCEAPDCSGCADCRAACRCAGLGADCGDLCGASGGCRAPSCNRCDTCFDECYCTSQNAFECAVRCGLVKPPPPPPPPPPTGGAAGAGGFGGFCEDGVCPSSPPIGGVALPGCCVSPVECGVRTDTISAVLGPLPQCVRYGEPGRFEPACPMPPLPPDVPIAACCNSQSLCGVDLSILGLGCVTRFTADGGAIACRGTGGTGGLPGTGGFPATGGVTGSGGFGATGGSGGAGGRPGPNPIETCLSQAHDACEACACASCFEDLLPCFADAGCPEILQCANRTGCTGVDCYSPATCQSVIDRHGGPTGRSTALASPLFNCVRSSGCPCGFAE